MNKFKGKKRIFALGIVVFCLGFLTELQANELTLYVIKPVVSIDWMSPRSLVVSSSKNFVLTDYAQFGHVSIEVSCSGASVGNHILTGMNPLTSDTVYDESSSDGGLGVLLSKYSGRLENSQEVMQTVKQAHADQRLKIIRIPTSQARCHQMMTFLGNWIRHGSYYVYGGGKNTEQGEGATCTDFAMEFFKIATNMAIPGDWKTGINIPKEMIGKPEESVSITDVFLKGERWATQNEPHVHFEIPDPGYIYKWIESRDANSKVTYMYTKHIFSGEILFETGTDMQSFYNEKFSELPAVVRKPFVFTPKVVGEKEKIQLWKNIMIQDSKWPWSKPNNPT